MGRGGDGHSHRGKDEKSDANLAKARIAHADLLLVPVVILSPTKRPPRETLRAKDTRRRDPDDWVDGVAFILGTP